MFIFGLLLPISELSCPILQVQSDNRLNLATLSHWLILSHFFDISFFPFGLLGLPRDMLEVIIPVVLVLFSVPIIAASVVVKSAIVVTCLV
jgi:hypothetical protein